jgi:hypothetical protein
MIMETKEGIIREIKEYISSKGNQMRNWHVGVTNASSKIFADFNVNKAEGFWIYITAESNTSALSIRDTLIKDGLIEAPAKTDEDYNIVFAYKIPK